MHECRILTVPALGKNGTVGQSRSLKPTRRKAPTHGDEYRAPVRCAPHHMAVAAKGHHANTDRVMRATESMAGLHLDESRLGERTEFMTRAGRWCNGSTPPPVGGDPGSNPVASARESAF